MEYNLPADLNFGQVLHAMRRDSRTRVARAGWNGEGMFIFCITPEISDHSVYTLGLEVLPALCMKTADNKLLIGWLASQIDMLAEDWMVL